MERLFLANTARDITRAIVFDQAPVDAMDEQGDTALHAAIRRGAPIEVIAELVRLGASLEALTRCRRSALFLAVELHPDTEVMDFLLESGARPNGMPYRPSPLHAAVFQDDLERVELLLTARADIQHRGPGGAPPLFGAQSGRMARRLIQAGANLYLQDREGRNALDWWRERGQDEPLRAVLGPPEGGRPRRRA